MNYIYIVIDKTDANFRRPFVAICKTEKSAQEKVQNIQSKLSTDYKNMISFQAVEVSDFDMNKSSVYVLYDKTDANAKKLFQSMHFDYNNAVKALQALHKNVPSYAKKLIYTRVENLI